MQVKAAFNEFKGAFSQPLTQRASGGGLGFVENLGRHTAEAHGVWGTLKGAALDTVKFVPRVLGGTVKAAAWGAVALGGGVAAAGIWLVKQPVAGVLKLGAMTVRGVRRHPVIAGLAVGVPVVAGAISWLNSRDERLTQEDLMSQAMAAQQQVAAASMAGAPQKSYMNTVTKADMEAIDARMQADGKAAGSHVDAVTAARAQAKAPETADLALL